MSSAVVIREMYASDARAFLEVHHAAVRGTAAKDYPRAVIDAWAPLPVTRKAMDRVIANPHGELRLIAELNGEVVGIGAIVVAKSELRACYVRPDLGRSGIGSALVRELEETARRNGLSELVLDSSITAEPFYRACGYRAIGSAEHVLQCGQRMVCVKMRKRME